MTQTFPQLMRWFLVAMAVAATSTAGEGYCEPTLPTIDFHRDVRPLLADKCFRCHGPDEKARQGQLRLDQRESAIAMREGTAAIVPGRPDQSELMKRIEASDGDLRMPPPDSKLELSAHERETLRRWIASGAEYQTHWAFTPPRRAAAPTVANVGRPLDPLDCFILSPLERAGRTFSPETDRATWLRRVSFDLTGLPPTLERLDEFLVDSAPDAHLRELDRLLASPAWGERMAVDWLDAARYADTNGYFGDNPRSIWPWRDWVIRSFNQGMPFDDFTVRQLAGDLLPNATRDDLVATGFNRNHMMNDETGLIDEEYRVEYVADRLETTATTWLGLTVGCARCHDHKYDPISQRDYYGLFAFFNQGPETGLITARNPPPTLEVPSAELSARIERLKAETVAAEKAYEPIGQSLMQRLAAWEKDAAREFTAAPQLDLQLHVPFEDSVVGTSQGTELKYERGIDGKAALFDGTQHVETPLDLALDGPWTIGFWMHSTNSLGCPLSKIEADGDRRGFEILWQKGRFQIHLVHRWGVHAVVLTSRDAVAKNDWRHVVVTHDGSRTAAGIHLYVDGRLTPLQVRLDSLHNLPDSTMKEGVLRNREPFRIGRRDSGLGYYGRIDELRVLSRVLAADEIESWRQGERLRGALARPLDQRGADQEAVVEYFVSKHASEEERQARERQLAARRAEADAKAEIPVTLVMREQPEKRATFVLDRGQYNLPQERVEPGVPSVLAAWPTGSPSNRLGLAQWLVQPDHPLTSRVVVNRLWQQLFGEGLVRTMNDFGAQGELPTHPLLLDALAVDLVRDDWDLKLLMRRLAASATYRQSSAATPAGLAKDRDNRGLARGPRFRLSAEQLRDQALAVSGLLVQRLGGPSVKPYQPPGLWEEVSYNGDETYEPHEGEGQWRRSVYTYVKRQAPPPALVGFDAPTREKCSVRRARTNTPLQSLAMLNDPTYLHAARYLAARMLSDGEPTQANDRQRLVEAYRRITSRVPAEDELKVLGRLLEQQRVRGKLDASVARRIANVESLAFEFRGDPAELAAWTITLHTLLNLDEAITRR
jgi:hypothetical protein